MTVLQVNQHGPRRRSRQRPKLSLIPELLEARDCPSAFNPVDLLVVNGNLLSEYTPNGTLVQSMTVAYPGGGARPITESARGVAVGSSGLASVFNGSAAPYLSTLDPTTGTWTHTALTGDSVDNVAGEGQVGQYQQYVFAPNVGSTTAGLVRIDTVANSVTSLSTAAAYNNVTVGLDGLVYATEAAAPVVDIFDPTTLAALGSVTVGGTPRGVAVDANGHIFVADDSGVINEFAHAGGQIGSINPNAGSLTSITVAANGEVVAGTSSGNVVVTDETGSAFAVFPTNSSSSEAYVAFVSPQTPSPVFNSAANATFTAGTAGSFTVESLGAPVASLIETGALPSGVTFIDNGDGTATLAGTPDAGTGGTYSFTITAHNGVGADTPQSFTLTVQEAPTIISASATNFIVGTVGAFTVTTGNSFPAAVTLQENGKLPSGVTFTDNGDGTATLTGTPAVGADGSYAVTITAHNGVGVDFTQNFTLTVMKKSVTTLTVSPKTVVFGQPLTFTATVLPGTGIATVGGTVTFTDNGIPLGAPVTLVNNRATFSTKTLGAGSHSLQVVFSGNAPYGASASTPATETVTVEPTSVLLSPSTLAPRYGQNLTFTAHVLAGAFSTAVPAGTIAFMDGTTTLGTVNLTNGYATLSTNSLTIGTHPIKAVYTPANSNQVASSSGVLNETVNKAFVTMTLSALPTPSVAGQEVDLTASVTVVAPASATPSGNVTFKCGLTVLGTATLDSNGVAILPTTSLNTGIQTIVATYGGDATVFGGTGVLRMTVNQATTSVALTASPDTILATQPFTLTAAVTVASPAVASPTGTVSFYNGTMFYGTATLNNGVAKFVVTQKLAANTYNFTAHYNGNLQCKGSGTTLSVVVNPIGQDADTITLSSNASPSPSNTPITFTATVAAVDSSNGMPTGFVTFYNGKSTFGLATLDSNGVATLSPVTWPAGTYSIKAVYSGDISFQAITSAVYSQTVTLGTSTTMSVNTVVAYYGSPITLSARVNPATTSAVVPTGTITWYDGATALGTATVANNVASLPNQLLGVGAHQLTAVYTSASNGVAGSTSGVFNQTINLAITKTTMSTSLGTIVFGQVVTLTAAVTITNGAASPSGSVTFKDGSAVLGTVNVSNGIAKLVSTSIGTGIRSLTAYYNGDSTTNTSNGGVGLHVNSALTSVDFSSTPQYGVAGQAFTLTANVNVTAPGSATPTGTVSFFSSAGFLGTVPVNNGVAKFVTAKLAAGHYTYSAKYNGDSHLSASALASCSWQMVLPPVVNSVTLASANGTDASGTVSLTGGGMVTATVSGSDPQNFAVTYTYQWEIDGLVVQTDSNVSGTSDSFNLLSLLGGSVSPSQTVTVVVTPNNGVLDGTAKTSNNLSVTA
jgi:hypothetical protein